MFKQNLPEKKLSGEYLNTRIKLHEAKSKGIKLIACDYDGTIFDRNDPNYDDPWKTIELAYEVSKKDIEFAFVSGRNTTLELPLRDLIPQFCKKVNSNLTIWRSGGNGMNLSRITYTPDPKKIKVEEIYSNSISLNELKIAIKVYEKFNIKPDKKGKAFFQSFLDRDLPTDLVPPKFLQISKPHEGKFFAESVKVTFVLPTDEKEQEKYIKLFRKKLEPIGLSVGWGRIPFADVSKQLKVNGKLVDGKLLMVDSIMKKLKLKDSQIVTFGDAPNDNNAGLLSFPYSFTNDFQVKKRDLNSPPFILKVDNSPIAAVYKAIKSILE
ncbi:hypothetical protein A3A46_01670 [Candidatus Roizmanbacteria bacterium RIFCSPLOWO2_01_FULL_37_13]|nr:MAG: hypothetical protein A3A46_01670 [Candidatus Roizmanbacteria bacterium RIFCSPLOWO2_01_FULL_37_13]